MIGLYLLSYDEKIFNPENHIEPDGQGEYQLTDILDLLNHESIITTSETSGDYCNINDPEDLRYVRDI